MPYALAISVCLAAVCAYGWYRNARGWRLAREWSDIQALHLNGFALELGIDHAGAPRPARAGSPAKAEPRIVEPPPLPTVAFDSERCADYYPADALRSRKTHGFSLPRFKTDDELSPKST